MRCNYIHYMILDFITCSLHPACNGRNYMRLHPYYMQTKMLMGLGFEDLKSVGPASGNPRKFRHGIYLVYTWYILLAFVILVYTRYMTGICFLGKSIFVYHWMHVCMQWLLPKYTIHRALDGDLFSKSYIEFNISMVYDRHLLGIHLVYTTFVLVLILSE